MLPDSQLEDQIQMKRLELIVMALMWSAVVEPRWDKSKYELHRHVDKSGVENIDDRNTSQLLWRRDVSLKVLSWKVRRGYAWRLTAESFQTQLEDSSHDHLLVVTLSQWAGNQVVYTPIDLNSKHFRARLSKSGMFSSYSIFNRILDLFLVPLPSICAL